MISLRRAALRFSLVTLALALAQQSYAQVLPPAGYIYGSQLLASPTQNCIAAGAGGTFVGVGPGFTPNAQAVVFAKESGETRLVAFGFSSIGGCTYDRTSDSLYITDNAASGDFGLSPTLVPSGDTVYAVANASTAAALLATDIELLPSGSIPFAASVALAASGDLLVGDAAGGGNGSVRRITDTLVMTDLVTGLDFTGGIAVDPQSGDVFVAEFLSSFDNQVSRYSSTGVPISAPLIGPSFSLGSADLLFLADGSLMATGVFFGDVAAIDVAAATSAPFISGLTFATGATVDSFTKRISLLSSTFSGADEDKSLHRFTSIDSLVPGTGSAKTECLHELYGIELIAPAPGRKAREAICVDGAPCDADGKENGECLFPIGSCFQVLDSRFLECDRSSEIVEFGMTARPDSASVRALSNAVHAALPIVAQTPACFFSDGVVVPLRSSARGLKSGKAKVSATARTAAGKIDRDTLALVCVPAAP